jgi:HEPN domain-containing protein
MNNMSFVLRDALSIARGPQNPRDHTIGCGAMNGIYDKVLRKLEALDPSLGEAILKQALKAAGTTPDEVTASEMKQAYELHLKGVLNKYPDSPKVKAVRNTINTLGNEGFAHRDEARTAAENGEKLKEGRITEELYAQPNGEEPLLLMPKLKAGEYEEGTLWGLASVLRFTTVGGAFWCALNKRSTRTLIKLEDFSQLEYYKAWTVSLISTYTWTATAGPRERWSAWWWTT